MFGTLFADGVVTLAVDARDMRILLAECITAAEAFSIGRSAHVVLVGLLVVEGVYTVEREKSTSIFWSSAECLYYIL